jgi:probable phosphoglycerate mutase
MTTLPRMAIFLIRHGETAWNAARIVQPPEVPLSERGLAQASALARRLAAEGVAAIVSSDLRRAAMTAECIGASTSASVVHWQELQERNFGEIRGVAYADLGFELLAPDYQPPGGECWQAFHDRVASVWPRVVELASATAGNLAVVTHGLVCHSLALRHLRLPPDAAAPRSWGNASLTVVAAVSPWEVSLLNCTAHLEV